MLGVAFPEVQIPRGLKVEARRSKGDILDSNGSSKIALISDLRRKICQ